MKKVFILLAMFLICSAVYANMGFANISLGTSFDTIDFIYETQLIEEDDNSKSKLYMVDISKTKISDGYSRVIDLYCLFQSYASPISVVVDENNKVIRLVVTYIGESETIINTYISTFNAYTSSYRFPDEVYDVEDQEIFPNVSWSENNQRTFLGGLSYLGDETAMFTIIIDDIQSE